MRNKASEYVEKHFSEAETKRFKKEIEKFLRHYELDAARRAREERPTGNVKKYIDLISRTPVTGFFG